MKQTMKRALALLMALLLAIPTFAFSEESQQLEVVLADGENGQPEAGNASQPGGGDGETPLDAPGDAPQAEAPDGGAPAVDPNAEVTYCFIVNNQEYASQIAREGDAILPPDAPDAPEGMAFDGWFLEDGTPLFCDADGDGKIDEVIAHPDGFTTLVNVDAAFVKAGEEPRPSANEENPTQKPSPDGEGVAPQSKVTDEVPPQNETTPDNEAQEPASSDTEENPTQKPSPDGEGVAPQSKVTDEVPPQDETTPDNEAQEPASSDTEAADTPSDTEENPTQKPSPDGEGVAPQSIVTDEVPPQNEMTPDGEAQESASPDGEAQDTPSDSEENPTQKPSPDGEGVAPQSIVTDEVPPQDETTPDNEAQEPASSDTEENPTQKPSPDGEGVAPQSGVTDEVPPQGETTPDNEAQEPASPDSEAADTPSDTEESPEISAAPVSVYFTLDPENAALTVYPLSPDAASAAIGEALDQPQGVSDLPTPAPIPAQPDGSYALLPGEYAYSAEAEGYASVSNIPFTVVESDEALFLSVTLEPAPQAEPMAFEQSRTVNGVIVTVKAEAGAFPEGATLSVARVPVMRRREAESAVEEAREDDRNVAVSYTFDIKVLGADGGELQPAEGFGVEVSFALAQAADENLEANVYHVTQDANGDLTAAKLDEVDVDAAEQTVTAQTDGFSLYTVEFTYNALQFVLEGGASVPLSAVLEAVGLVGEVEAASVSDEALFSVSDETGAWLLETHQPFVTEEWLKVTVNGVEYEITVTDAGAVETTYSVRGSIENVVAASVGATTETLMESTAKWYVVNQDVTMASRLNVEGHVNLILADGVTLNATRGIRVGRGHGLTVYGQGYGSGKLIATGKAIGDAGIGGNSMESGGEFTLYGGEVTATGSMNGAGIGGGDSGCSGVIAIYDGSLTATGGKYGAGIGGGFGGSQGGALTIWGGVVTAVGGYYAAGIGGGINFRDVFSDGELGGNGSYVNVYGGKVVARGGEYGAGIGGGEFGNGGRVSVAGTCEITAIADGGSSSEGVPAIGRGMLSDKSAEERKGGVQTEGSVVFPKNISMKAGSDAASAYDVTDYRYQEACRQSYVHITASNPVTNTINCSINQLHGDRVTDTIDVKNMQGEKVNSAESGEQFQTVVTLTDSTLKSLTATYTVGDAAQTLRWDKEEKSADGKVITYLFTMPNGVSGTVDIKAEVEAVKRKISLPATPAREGSVTGVVNGVQFTDSAMAIEGEEVRLQMKVGEEFRDYFVDQVVVTGDTSKTVYAKLENDIRKNIVKGDNDNEWVFKMPAEPVTVSVAFKKGCYFINLSGQRVVRRYYTEITSRDKMTLDGDGIGGGWYVVRGTANIQTRIDVTTDVNLILCDGATLNANGGIFVPYRLSASLTIWAQDAGSGKLVAKVEKKNWAGIGGNEGSTEKSGEITINGGDITAQGGYGAAGIGGGRNNHNQGAVTINVPKGKSNKYTTVNATGGKYGPGIGGGQNTNNQLTVINGGHVIAKGGRCGAGIGGGEGGGNEKIIINGGYVEGHGGELAAGLGGGQEAGGGGGMGGAVEVHGGTVGAYGGRNSAGIGAGDDGAGISYTQTGGSVWAWGGEYASAVGGSKGNRGGTVNITGGMLEASGSECAAIGPGKGGKDYGTLNISPGMMVQASNEGHHKYERIFTGPERAAACHYRRYARVEPCIHPNGVTYTPVDFSGHRVSGCGYCGLTERMEEHTWGGNRKETCTKCGYMRLHTLKIRNGRTIEEDAYYADGRRMPHYIFTMKDGCVEASFCEGDAVNLKVATMKNYAFTDAQTVVEGPVADYSEKIEADGAKRCAFTMPAGDVTLDFKAGLRSYWAYVSANKLFGSVKLNGSEDDVYVSKGLEEVTIEIEPVDGYVVHDVGIYKRNEDGSDGERVDVGQKEINRYTFAFVDSDLNVRVSFARSGTATVYHVLQGFDEYTAEPVWLEQPTLKPLSKSAMGTYSFQAQPSPEVVEGPLTPSAYEPVGYSLDFRTEGFSEIPGNRYITIEAGTSEIYVYYRPKNYNLYIFDETFSGHLDVKPQRTLSLPAGTPLTTYLDANGITPEGTRDDEYRWAKWKLRERSPLAEDDVMPGESLYLSPHTFLVDVIVMLDPGGYDPLATEDADLRGQYWDYSKLDYWGNMDKLTWEYGGKAEWSRTPVYLSADAPRSFRLVEGEPIPNEILDAMNDVTRAGYRLADWEYAYATGKYLRYHRWNAEEDAIPDLAYNYKQGKSTYNHGPDAGKEYYVVYLRAVWELRDALVVFDPGLGVWRDGKVHTTTVKPGEEFRLAGYWNTSTTSTYITGSYTEIVDPSGGKQSTGFWRDRDGLTHRQGTRLVYSETFEYVTEPAITTDPDGMNVIQMTAVFEDMPATSNFLRLYVGTGGDRDKETFSVPIPAGEGSGRFVVTVEDGVTRVLDGEGNELGRVTPQREGYTFLGWSEAYDGQPRQTLSGMVSRRRFTDGGNVIQGTVNIHARWAANEYDLSFDLDGGSWPEDTYVRARYQYGETIAAKEVPVPVRANYDFAGWEPGIPATMPARDVSLKAKWTPHVYTMTFTSLGEVIQKTSGVIGTPVPRPADPIDTTGAGMVFKCWSPDCPEGETLYMPGIDIDYNAQWLERLPKPAAPVARATDRETLVVENPAEGQAYSIDGGATWHRPDADGRLSFVHLTPGETYSVVTYAEGEPGVSLDSPVSDPTPVTLPRAVALRLDLGDAGLGICDKAAAMSPWLRGDFWAGDWPANAGDYWAFFAYGDYETPRSFMIDEGQPLDADTLQKLAGVWCTGWLPDGWTTRSGARWSADSKAVEAVFDSTNGGLKTATAISDDGDEYTYYFITLRANWKPRDARVAYDLNGGKWPAGQGQSDFGIAFSETKAIAAVEPVYSTRNRVWEFAGWTWTDAKGAEHTYRAGDSLTYGSVSDIPADDIGMDAPAYGQCAPNLIRLTAHYRLKPAVQARLRFVTNTDAKWDDYTVTVPQGEATADVRINDSVAGYTVSGGGNSRDYAALTREGHAFAGWYEDEALTKPVPDPIEVGRGGKTVYAKWNVLKYTVTLDFEGGLLDGTTTEWSRDLDYGAAIPWPDTANLKREHYEFTGWDLASLPATMPARDLTLTAQWQANEYRISFNTDGGTEVAPIEGKYGDQVKMPEHPTRDSFVFQGWKLQGGTDDAVALPATMPDTNPTYVAKWVASADIPAPPFVTQTTRNSLTVQVEQGQQYKLENGAWDTPTEGSHTFGGLTPGETYSVYTQKYNGTEWHESAPTLVTLPEAVQVKLDLGAYDADWPENPENQTYTDTAAAAHLDKTQQREFTTDMGAKVDMTLLSAATRDGCLLEFWEAQAQEIAWSDAMAITPENCGQGNVLTLKAKWKLRPANIVYTPNGGKWPDGSADDRVIRNVALGATVAIIDDVPSYTVNGQLWVFDHWEGKNKTYSPADVLSYDSLDAVTTPGQGADANNVIALKAVYKLAPAASGTLSFNSMGGSYYGSKTIAVTIPEGVEAVTATVNMSGDQTTVTISGASQSFDNPTREAHAFAGWSGALGGDAAAEHNVTFKRETLDQALYAVWTPNAHTITVKNLGETGSETAEIASVPYGTSLSGEFVAARLSDAQKTRSHARFKGEFANLPETMPDADVEVTAAWERAVYTVTLRYNDRRTANATISGVFGAPVNRPADPTREGCVFQGWRLNGESANLPAAMPDTNPTYDAAWIRKPAKPDAPEVTAKTRNALTVKAVRSQEYSLDNGATWTAPTGESLTFEGLVSGDTYDVITRVAAVPNVSAASEPSAATRVTLPQAVAVRLDLGAYDFEAGNGQAEKGAYWGANGADWPSYPVDANTPAHMDKGQHRSFIKDEGDTILVGRMVSANRDGYELVGWYTTSGTRWVDNSPANKEYYDSQTPVGAGADAYYTITLKARWKLRDAKLTYDPNNGGLGWQDGAAAPEAKTLHVGDSVDIASTKPVAPAGKMFVCWKDASGRATYHPEGEYGLPGTFEYVDLSAVTGIGVREVDGLVDNRIVLTAVFADVPDTNALLVFNSQGGSMVLPVGITIPEDKQSVTVEVSVNGGVTSVKYAGDGGEVIAEGIANPVRRGCGFTGWHLLAGNAASTVSVTFTRDIDQAMVTQTLYAGWDENTYTITFTNLGGADAVVSAKYGSVLSPRLDGWPANPQRSHYRFVEWSPALPESMPAENLTVGAVWEPNKYSVTFDTDGGSEVDSLYEVYGARIAAPVDPTKEGCVFQGWLLDGAPAALPDTMPDTNPTYVAAWKAKQTRPEAPAATVTSRESLTVNAVQGQKYLLVLGSTTAADTRSGDWRQPAEGSGTITFDGLTPGATYSLFTYKPATGSGDLDSDASEPAIVTMPEAVSVWLELGAYDANWTGNPGNQTYTDQATKAYMDAAQARSFIAQTGEKIDMTHMSAATRDGYLPDGWSALDSAWSADRAVSLADCESGGKVFVEGVPYPCYKLTLKANWKLRDAELTYDPANGDQGWEADAPQAQTIASGARADITTAVPKAPAGKRFAYWKNERNGATYAVGDTIGNDDPAAIEKWGAGNANNGIALKAVYIDENAKLGLLSLDSMGGSEVYPVRVVIPEGRNSVEVTVSVTGGKTMVTVDGVPQMIANPTQKGYTFEGWRDDEGKAATTLALTFTQRTLEQTLFAEWKGKLHRIIVKNLGETGTQASIEVRYGTPISNAYVMRKLKDAEMAREHKVIQGFTPRLSGTMPDRDLEVTAIWEEAVYTITLVYNDGVTPGLKISDIYGAAITDWPTDPTREGHTFRGWKRLGMDEVLDAPLSTMPGENRTYGAQWTVNSYTITFDSDGGSEVAPITLYYNMPVTAPANPVKAHSDFVRWEPELPARMPAENLTVDAVWQQHNYIITFMDGDAVYYRPVGAYGDKVNPPVDPTREGDAFKGWSTDGTTVVDLPAAMPDTNPTYYAVWKASQAAPAKPAGRAVSDTAIQVVDPVSTQEYRLRLADGDDAGWSEWIRPKNGKVEFTGLQPATKYVIQARMIETEEAEPSDPSELSDPVETLKGDQEKPEPPVLNAGVGSLSVVDPSDAMEYQYADVDAPDAWSDWRSPQDGKLTFEGLKEGHDYLVRARLKETAKLNLSEPSDSTLAHTFRTMVEEIEIIGDPVVGNTLKVRVKPASVAKYLYYFWYRNGEYVKVQIFSEDVLPDGYQLSEGLEACYTLTEEDIGAKIRLVVTQVDVDTPLGIIILSDETGEVRGQTSVSAAKKPVLKGRARTSLTVETQPGEEYSIDGGKTWQKKGVFKGLKPNKTYSIIARVAATKTTPAGPASKALKAKTLKEPKGMLIAKLSSNGKTALNVTWSSVKNVVGYDVFVARCNKGGKNYKLKLVKSVSAKGKRKVVVKGLKKNVMYKAEVRAYIIENGKKVYVIDSPLAHAYTNKRGTNHSNAKRISVNKQAFTLKKGKSATIKAKVTPEKKGTKVLGHVAKVRYYSSNPAVATVNKNGRIKAVAKGKCVIYCVTHNGIFKAVNVRVK